MLAAVLVLAAGAGPAAADGPPLAAASIVEHVGAPVPQDVPLVGSTGERFELGDLLSGKPLVITLAYFTCPMLCQLVTDGAADAFAASGLQLGRDFRAVTISIDPNERLDAARAWRARAATRMHRSLAALDWRFAKGREADVRRIANALGYRYAFDPASGQFSHPAVLFVVTADGHVARYLYGISFDADRLDAALDAAQVNQGGSSVERFLLRCYHYVPSIRRHGSFVVWLLRLGGLTVTVVVSSLLLVLWRRGIRRGA